MATIQSRTPSAFTTIGAAAPANGPAAAQGELPFVRDHRYAFHGKILMLVLFTVFASFICVAAVIPCLNRLRRKGFSDDEADGVESSRTWKNSPAKEERKV